MSNKLKTLFFGSAAGPDAPEALVARLEALQAGAAGPFDAAVCVGACGRRILELAHRLPVPLYLHALEDAHRIVAALEPPNGADDGAVGAPPVVRLADRLFLLAAPGHLEEAGVWSLPVKEKQPPLVVANCPGRARVDGPACRALLESLRHVSYTGCDVLITGELPQGADRVLHLEPPEEVGAMSFDVADIALRARPRYHVVAAARFQQSAPFVHLRGTTSTAAVQHVGRLLTVAPVLAAAAPAGAKPPKSVHALGLVPLHACSAAELAAQRPAAVLDCPYTDAAYRTDDGANAGGPAGPRVGSAASRPNAGLSEASARRILAEEQHRSSGMPSERWAQSQPGRRRGRDGADDDDAETDDPSNKTLFLHGLHKDVTGQLQQNTPAADAVVLRALAAFQARRVRKPPGATTSSFCFVDFETHEQADACRRALGGRINIGGVDLAVKWATSSKRQRTENEQSHKAARLTEADARDSCTLYFKIPGSVEIEKLGEAVRRWAEETLEDALADGGEKVVTAQDEPALQVKLRLPQSDVSYGFLDFASHAAGSMAVASLTGSTDGGRVLPDVKGRPGILQETVVYLNWSKARTENENNIIEDASGFKFERKHFPADSRQDCWFCLASEACEKHLITGVFDTCYTALAKGPVHPGHVLLIPVQHSSEGALKNTLVAEEMDALKERLRRHASVAYDMDLFVFERAIQTKGGYHTHLQCIPIERKLGPRLQTTMQAQAKKLGFALREINSDLGLSSVLRKEDDEDGDGEGYFYVEIPSIGEEFKRFVYKSSAGSRVSIPLQFGRELLASVLGKPELAHWKSCVLDQQQEAELATSFRESFSNANGSEE